MIMLLFFRYKNKKIFLHVASECFVPFNIGIAYKKNFIFRNIFNNFILMIHQSGLFAKITRDIEWEITQRSGVQKVIEFSNFLINLNFYFKMFFLVIVNRSRRPSTNIR